MKKHLSNSTEETHAIARELLPALPPNAVIALHGELGSGKTCFVQGLANAMDIKRPITSPTFTIINEYPNPEAPLYHIDLYRIQDPNELTALGFEDYLEKNGIKAIEWAERAQDLIPVDAVHINFETGEEPNTRILTVR